MGSKKLPKISKRKINLYHIEIFGLNNVNIFQGWKEMLIMISTTTFKISIGIFNSKWNKDKYLENKPIKISLNILTPVMKKSQLIKVIFWNSYDPYPFS